MREPKLQFVALVAVSLLCLLSVVYYLTPLFTLHSSQQQPALLHHENLLFEQQRKHTVELQLTTTNLQQENSRLKREISKLQAKLNTKRPTKFPTTLAPTFRFKDLTDDDYADVYKPQRVHVGKITTSPTGTLRPTPADATNSPTPLKTNMPTHPYSHAPTFVAEIEENYMMELPVQRETTELLLLPVEFTPYAKGSVAHEIENTFDFPKHTLDQVQQALNAAADTWPVPNDSGIHVITTFFRGTYSMARVREVLSSIVSNLENPYIATVHVLWEVDNPLQYIPLDLFTKIPNLKNKLVLAAVKQQPTYRQMFKYANEELQRGAVAIITNGDIYFDSSVGCVRTRAQMENDDGKRERRQAFALSRRHSHLCGNLPDHDNAWVTLFDLCLEYTQAHDHFVFAPPVPESMLKRVDHTQNAAYGAENVVIHEFRQANFSVFNYCHTVRGYHNHCVLDRHSSPHLSISKVPGNFRHGIKYPSGKGKPCEEMWVY